jgi:hypothetical protein
LSIFDIVNCADYIKNNYPDFKLFFYINDRFNTNVLNEVLNINFFESFFSDFKILNSSKLFKNNFGISVFDNIHYKRLYSGRNELIFNNIPGIFDVFVPIEHYEYFQNLKIPFIDFTFDNNDDRVKDFDIFNKKIVNSVNKFVEDNYPNGFESIYYRVVPPINEKRILEFRNVLDKNLTRENKYFLCSNSSFVKRVFSETDLNIIHYKKIENHDLNFIPNGFVLQGLSLENALFAVAEMLILSKGNKIHYCGDMTWVSLFNWYSINIKKVKLNEIII